jgi:predicted RNA-binding Zn ribbon-like protein
MSDNPFSELSLIGGRLSLDFLNTVDTHAPLLDEKLGTYADLVWWALRVGAVAEADAAPLFAAADADSARGAAVLAGALELRESLFRVFIAARAGVAADGGDVAVVNDALARTLGHQRVAQGEDGFAWTWEEVEVELERPLWAVVRDAAELLVGGELRRVGKCCGDDCDWLYLDTSRNRSRRWCDMQSCGNRAKARRHYHKAKGGAGD